MKDTNTTKPQTLYRGIVMRYPLPKDFKFSGTILKPPNKPLIDKDGHKTVLDGNEYGVYMTDYIEVAKVYAKPEEQKGTKINPNITFSNSPQRCLVIPAIGIIYKIDTTNLEVHKPWITSTLKGHYNNGFSGDEWITEKIPPENYKVESIQIGADFLHEAENIDISNPSKISEIITNKIEKRRERLEDLEKYLEKEPLAKRMTLTPMDLEVLKAIYKENGLRTINVQNFKIMNGLDCITFLMTTNYLKNTPDNIDFRTLKYLTSLKSDLENRQIRDAVTLLGTNINKKISDKYKFIERKEKNQESYTTAGHDNTIKMYQDLLHELIEKLKKDIKDFQLYYAETIIRIDNLSTNNQITPSNKKEQLSKLLKQKEVLNNLISERNKTIKKYQSEFIYNEDNNNIILAIEKLLGIKISATSLYQSDTNNRRMILKDEETLLTEETKITILLEKLYSSGKINIQKYQTMINAVHIKYQKMLTIVRNHNTYQEGFKEESKSSKK